MAQTAQDEIVRGAGHGLGAFVKGTGGVGVQRTARMRRMPGIPHMRAPQHMPCLCEGMPTRCATLTFTSTLNASPAYPNSRHVM